MCIMSNDKSPAWGLARFNVVTRWDRQWLDNVIPVPMSSGGAA